ncbi:hypothetical protein GCM10010284_34780 [Streptomyces rubiginosohelvolus]|uniref:Uncharacterized protein n=1 Tax=Streptomyces rubiginosohelvolus TaxID=67362 RepID=A0ABQ3BIF8_9ACTN|nr:hypothetical protein GCM10010284_34780 [Streptomyces rubiginosohelvolus]GGZ45642.1 hypothetical protein GCM10010328_20210 [Streptomyces pluricolorescens]
MELVEKLHALAPLLDTLDEPERTILAVRFGQEMTSGQCAAVCGVPARTGCSTGCDPAGCSSPTWS